ncbi:hypothetical protein NDU88_004798 [Pleurodeles waltl]|uniref:Uncharacterized protein n=1 Tax=Pleurodeles waltl TaxID=8319 RepID=A0AAV7WSZ6_PLEWA|nr:hypothetical protein NDU88_004798 [Pleurodeles waltl]
MLGPRRLQQTRQHLLRRTLQAASAHTHTPETPASRVSSPASHEETRSKSINKQTKLLVSRIYLKNAKPHAEKRGEKGEEGHYAIQLIAVFCSDVGQI